MQSRVLVVGSTGNVGRQVVASLARRGVRVRAATRNPEKIRSAPPFILPGVEPVALDLRRPETVARALEGVTDVVLMNPPGETRADLLLGPVVERVVANRVRKIVLVTAMGIEFDDRIPLRQVELQVERSGVPHTLLRPTWYMQNFQTFWLPGILAHNVIALPAKDARTAFIDARDVGDAAVAALAQRETDGKAYALTGGESLSYADAAKILSVVSGRSIRYEHISDDAFRKVLTQAGLAAEYAETLVAMFGMVRDGMAAQVLPDAATLLGRAPRTLADYARDHALIWQVR